MNIALSAVIISILLIHPFIFYFSFYLGKYTRAIPKFSLFEGLLGSAIISLLIHAIAIAFISKEIRFDILIKLLGGDLKNIEGSIKNIVFKGILLEFASYNFWLILVMFFLGRLIRRILLFKNFHASNEILHLYHEWWYFFNGYSYEEEKIIEYDVVFIKAVVDTKNGRVFYYGYLVDFETIGRQLDRIYLVNASRKQLDDVDQNHDDIMDNLVVPIEGTTISIKYEDITRLTVDFIVLGNEPSVLDQLELDLI